MKLSEKRRLILLVSILAVAIMALLLLRRGAGGAKDKAPLPQKVKSVTLVRDAESSNSKWTVADPNSSDSITPKAVPIVTPVKTFPKVTPPVTKPVTVTPVRAVTVSPAVFKKVS